MTRLAKRSLKVSPNGIKRVNKAILIFGTKIDFAAELEISRATVQNFFAGKPVGRENFHKICEELKLPWQEIAELPEDPEAQAQELVIHNGFDIDALVQEVRKKGSASIIMRCGMMRVLDMSQPIVLNDIYVNVNILEKISGRRRLEVAYLLKACVPEKFERPDLGSIAQERVLGIEAIKKYPKLMVLGKPGAGKTMFLKYVAIQCSLGEFQANCVPIFISLKDFAETQKHLNLLEYIIEQFWTYGITDTSIAEQLLLQGKMLILLDGLDEVRKIDSSQVLQEVRNFSAQFHINHFVITCRTAAQEYTFEQFTEVEVTDFDEEQIATFAIKWFQAKAPVKAERFIQKFKVNKAIQELATCPLLLTLLCLIFEEFADFPVNRAVLYQEGLDVLLKNWDAKRNIEREQVYKKLSAQHKKDLLSQIARITFERGDCFFKQKEIEQHISYYIRNLPSDSADPEALQLNSEAVLKSIEAQHGLLVKRARGIYSFSHMAFHKYFTAREIVTSSAPQALEMALQHLVSQIANKCWREVFLLTVEMLPNADYLLQLMKQQIDQLVTQDEHLQALLTWVSQKASASAAPYKRVAIRAFYLEHALAFVTGNLALDLVLAASPFNLALTLDCNLARTLILALDLDDDCVLNPGLEREAKLSPLCELLQQLKEQLYDSDKNTEKLKAWWQANGQAWTEKLRVVMIEHRNIGHNWQFSAQQREALKQYYNANQLLVDCLNSDCYVTRAVRYKIEETLLFPPEGAT